MFNIDSDKLYIYKKQYKFYNIFLLVRFYYLTTIILTKSSTKVFFFFFYTSKIVEIAEDIPP